MLKKGTIIKCIEDVFMPDGTRVFTKGGYYRTYPYTITEMFNIRVVTCAKNDNNKRHIIIDREENDYKAFFDKHFEIVDVN